MAYLPDGLPLPQPGPDDQAYWDFIRQRELRIQTCANCRHPRHPPSPACPRCGSFASEWVPVSGRGTVYTYTIAYHPAHRALKDQPPYNVAVILLDDAGDVRIVSNVIDAAPHEMRIGLPVVLVWEAVSDGTCLPRFRKA
ncbi:MAG: Zn-ribbon domain-containing OB-fold protein [Burkholderiaceae bacterium]